MRAQGANDYLPSHYVVANSYFDEELERAGVKNNSLYAVIDELADNLLGALRVNVVEQGALHLEAGYDLELANNHRITNVFTSHGYVEFGRTALSYHRNIIHFRAPQGITCVDIVPRESELLDWFFPPPDELYSHEAVAEDFLARRIHDQGIEEQSVFGFLDVLGLYCDDQTMKLRNLHNGTRPSLEIIASMYEEYVGQDVLRALGNRGLRTISAVNIESSGNAKGTYQLAGGGHAHLYLRTNNHNV